MVSYQLRVYDESGNLAAVLTEGDMLSMHCQHRVNDISLLEVVINADASEVEEFVRDRRVELWRKMTGGEWYLEFAGLYNEGVYYQDEDGKETFTAHAVGLQDILRRRIIAAPAGSSQSSKSGPAESVAKEFVDEQVVNPTITARAVSNFVIEADSARGNTVSIQRTYRNLLEVLQEIAAVGGGDFDVVLNDSNQYEFRWYDGQRGTDRRSEVVFSTAFGNMLTPRLQLRAPVATTVLVAGQGEGASRTWVWRPSETGVSGLERMEVMRDARDTDSTSIMEQRGDAELEELAGGARLTFKPLQTSVLQYGRDYFLGDLVTAYYRGMTFDLKIVQVNLRLTESGEEISMEFEEYA